MKAGRFSTQARACVARALPGPGFKSRLYLQMQCSPTFSYKTVTRVELKFDGASFPKEFRAWLQERTGGFLFNDNTVRTCKIRTMYVPEVKTQDGLTVFIPGRDASEDGKVIAFSSREDLDAFTAALKACWACWKEETKAAGSPAAAKPTPEWTTVTVE
jgi:hypothetical protein